MTATEAHLSGPSRREGLVVAVGVLVLAAVHVAVAAAFGALGVSRNDDWVYYRIAFASAAHGGFNPDPYTSTMLVGLIALARPVMAVFGADIVPLQLFVALLGALGLWAAWWTVRHFLSRGLALLALATLALGPVWGALSVSFMSDVPAFAVQAVGIAFCVKAVKTGRLRWPWFTASVLACLLAFSIREYSVAALLVVALTAFLTAPADSHRTLRDRGLVTVMTVAAVAAAVALYRWRGAQTSGAAPRSIFLQFGDAELRAVVKSLFTMGLLLPPAVLGAPRRLLTLARRRWVASLVAVGALMVAAAFLRGDVLIGNVVTSRGSYSETLSGQAARVVPQVVWLSLVGVSIVASALVLVGTWDRARRLVEGTRVRTSIRRLHPALVATGLFAVASPACAIGVTLAFHVTMFDRYLLPAIPYAAALV
ncbi:MAG: Dolichyl-phosphate-mannose-protein mannosyltransferase, partial [Humibacillus sp.]|nr:Dolichyl-phosphate-mannose-protein mannosyltransferase [Humibacillus sp.]